MNVALYARVSLDEKADDRRYQDPENQLVPLRQWVAGMGWTITNEYVDRASGADPARFALREMLQDAHLGKFKAIVVWKMDRFSREPMLTQLARIKEMQQRGVALISMTESWLDTRKDNPMSELVLAIMSFFAGEERRKISERTKAGIRRRRAIGQWKGGRPKKVSA